MAKIDIDRFICSMIERSMMFKMLQKCLKDQGLKYKDGELVEIDSIKAENYVCKKELRYNSGNGIIVHYEPGNKESLSNLKKRCRGITNDIIDEYFSLATEIDQPPLTEEQKPKSQIQHAQAYVEKDLDLVGNANGVIPHKDEQGIDRSSCTSTKENNKPQTIKFNEEPKFKVGQTIIYKGTENIAPTKMTISDIAKGQYWDDNCCIIPISDQDEWELEKPSTIKFKTKDESIYQDKSPLFLDSFDNLRVKSIDLDKVDIDKMVEEYRETLDPYSHLIYALKLVSSYKKGLEDMLKLIKRGGGHE